MDHRLKEHKRALTSGNTAQSRVAEHAVDQMHEINWKEPEVVDSHLYYSQRCVLETWHIRMEHQGMNCDKGCSEPSCQPRKHDQAAPSGDAHNTVTTTNRINQQRRALIVRNSMHI